MEVVIRMMVEVKDDGGSGDKGDGGGGDTEVRAMVEVVILK